MVLSLRQEEILNVARAQGRVTVDGLAEQFSVTPQTIRRDLGELCDAGALSRVHGGAILKTSRNNIGYMTRRALAEQEKDAIGRLCSAEIPNDCSLFVNIGTTTEAVARWLCEHRNIMVITNNLNVANILAENDHCEVIVAGGVLRRSDGGLVGEATGDFIRQFKVDYAIIGASALDDEGYLFDFDYREVRVAQQIIRNARQVFLVADNSKFGRTAPVRICHLSEIHGFFTDAPPPERVSEICNEHGVMLCVRDDGHED